MLPHDRRAHWQRAVHPDNGEDVCAGRGEVVDGGGGGIRRGGRRRGRVEHVGGHLCAIRTDVLRASYCVDADGVLSNDCHDSGDIVDCGIRSFYRTDLMVNHIDSMTTGN